MKKIINVIKQKWLKDTVLTTVLVAVIIAIFIAGNIYINKINTNPIDFTKEKLYTLSDESINQVKDIDQDVHIYFFGYEEDNKTVSLAKQYENANKKIKAEAIDINSRKDLAEKYGIDSNESIGIIVEGPTRYKVLTQNDFYTYDTTTYETIDISEQKLTNAIIDTKKKKKPHVYFLTGHDEYETSSYLATLNVYIQNEINEVSNLDLLQADVPADCDTLVIPNPTKDFEEVETNKILDYINKGGKIIWLGEAKIEDTNTPNINKVLEQFGLSFSKGIIMEEDSSKMILESPELILTNITYHDITKDLSNVVVASAGRINIESDEKLKELNVTVNKLLSTSEKSFYREDFSIQKTSKTDTDESGPFTVGAEFVKKINDNTESKLIAFSNCDFVTDMGIKSGNTQLKLINLYDNKDLILNSIAYLTDRGDTIRIRKDTGYVTYKATQKQDNIVRLIIFVVPLIIIIFGIVIWQIRRRKK